MTNSSLFSLVREMKGVAVEGAVGEALVSSLKPDALQEAIKIASAIGTGIGAAEQVYSYVKKHMDDLEIAIAILKGVLKAQKLDVDLESILAGFLNKTA